MSNKSSVPLIIDIDNYILFKNTNRKGPVSLGKIIRFETNGDTTTAFVKNINTAKAK